MDARTFLADATPSREVVDRFLDPDAVNWAAFDPVLGYRLRNSVVQDGVDGCYTISRYPDGARRMVNYADQPCRINTYGDSFTQCHQVSDGETWQEYLAAHFGEPVRNFGVGGYGVYQAYRRMLREEATAASAEYIVLNIWSDDHFRSVMSWRWLHIKGFRQHMMQRGHAGTDISLFHANPWAHVRLNTDTGTFEERENPYPTPESLYQLCDAEYVYESFREDDFVQVLLAQEGISDARSDVLERIAAALDLPVDFSNTDATIRTAQAIRRIYGLKASMFIVDKALDFAATNKRKLLVLLSFDSHSVATACRNQPRFDDVFVDYLDENNILYADTLRSHTDDYALYTCDPETYVNRYYIGHYNPQGNHFFAFAVKDAIADWLDPKPPAYREQGPSLQDMAGKLA